MKSSNGFCCNQLLTSLPVCQVSNSASAKSRKVTGGVLDPWFESHYYVLSLLIFGDQCRDLECNRIEKEIP